MFTKRRKLRNRVLALVFPMLLWMPGLTHAEDTLCPGGSAVGSVDYDVECEEGALTARSCTVDRGTYGGWVTFKERCATCHGDSAIANSEQVSLLRAVSDGLTYDEFTFVLFHGRHGDKNPMPSWKGNCVVMSDIDNLYRYLKARADEELPLGEPVERVPDRELPVLPVARR